MSNVRFALYALFVSIAVQNFSANALAADEAGGIANPNVVPESGKLQSQTASESHSLSIKPLNNDEMKTLAAAEAGSTGLLNQMAGDSRTECHQECALGGDCRMVCDTVDASNNSGGGTYSRSGYITAFVIAGAVFGSFGGPSGAIVGATAAGGLAAIMTSN